MKMTSSGDKIEWLTLQMSEVEMLESMYPNLEEFHLDDPYAKDDIQKCIDGDQDYDTLLSRLGFTLKLDITSKGILEMVCHLPHEYPAVIPQVFIRSEALSRPEHRQLSESLQGHLASLERGDLCLCSLIQWLEDNASSYMQQGDQPPDNKIRSKGEDKEIDTLFSRLWVYSHHIYSKIKRKDILNFAPELNLSGFCMPGKPGIICIEGSGYDVEEFWQRIRRMQWKKLAIKDREDIQLSEGQSMDGARKFKGFTEQHFEPRQGKGRGAHMDRGLLFQFLEQHGCGQVFLVYFGVEGRTADAEEDSE